MLVISYLRAVRVATGVALLHYVLATNHSLCEINLAEVFIRRYIVLNMLRHAYINPTTRYIYITLKIYNLVVWLLKPPEVKMWVLQPNNLQWESNG